MIKYFCVFLLFVVFSCQSSISSVIEEPSYYGVWYYEGANYSISIDSNSIKQISGFPIVNGSDIRYIKSGSILYCNYKNLDKESSSFKLDILEVNSKYLEFLKVTDFWSERIKFRRTK